MTLVKKKYRILYRYLQQKSKDDSIKNAIITQPQSIRYFLLKNNVGNQDDLPILQNQKHFSSSSKMCTMPTTTTGSSDRQRTYVFQ